VLGVLGATAARAILGPEFRLLLQRGLFMPTRWCSKTIATLHPSAVLRGQDDAEQARLYAMLRDDLRLVAAA
jgi:DNA polymerase